MTMTTHPVPRPNQFNSPWDDKRIAVLAKLWADGLSAGEIQKQMGAATRNVICGMVHRLGLKRENGYQSTATRSRTCRATAAAARSGSIPKKRFKAVDFRRGAGDDGSGPSLEPDVYVVTEPFDVPVWQRKTLLQLTTTTCRWPYNDPFDPDFYFCGGTGADMTENRPYCKGHSLLAASPPRQRVRRPFKE